MLIGEHKIEIMQRKNELPKAQTFVSKNSGSRSVVVFLSILQLEQKVRTNNLQFVYKLRHS